MKKSGMRRCTQRVEFEEKRALVQGHSQGHSRFNRNDVSFPVTLINLRPSGRYRGRRITSWDPRSTTQTTFEESILALLRFSSIALLPIHDSQQRARERERYIYTLYRIDAGGCQLKQNQESWDPQDKLWNCTWTKSELEQDTTIRSSLAKEREN